MYYWYNGHCYWSTENQDSGDFADVPIAWEMSSKTVRLKGRVCAGKGLCWAPCEMQSMKQHQVVLLGCFSLFPNMKHNIQNI